MCLSKIKRIKGIKKDILEIREILQSGVAKKRREMSDNGVTEAVFENWKRNFERPHLEKIEDLEIEKQSLINNGNSIFCKLLYGVSGTVWKIFVGVVVAVIGAYILNKTGLK